MTTCSSLHIVVDAAGHGTTSCGCDGVAGRGHVFIKIFAGPSGGRCPLRAAKLAGFVRNQPFSSSGISERIVRMVSL